MDLTSKGQGPWINLTLTGVATKRAIIYRHFVDVRYSVGLLRCIILKESSNNSAAAKSLQSCPTLCDPIDGSPPGSPIPGILQARTLEWVTISFSNA